MAEHTRCCVQQIALQHHAPFAHIGLVTAVSALLHLQQACLDKWRLHACGAAANALPWQPDALDGQVAAARRLFRLLFRARCNNNNKAVL